MSVAVVGREGLPVPFLSDDYLALRDQALQFGQEDGVRHMLQNVDTDRGTEGPRAEGSSGHLDHSHRSLSTDNTLEQHTREAVGRLEYGCRHYKRRCRIRAPCCGEVFDCRHCHNEAMNIDERDPKKRHELPRHAVESVICSICSTEQGVQKFCSNCGVCMGEYFCGKCRFFDDETKKRQYHCDACGICRIGGRDSFFHCQRCGCCYSIMLQKRHPCVEKSMHHNCPVCFEFLFDSMKDITVMPCGHTMHLECLEEMQNHSQFTCPLCSRSFRDMTKVWEQLDQEVAATPMPDAYRDKMVWILCNDCGATVEVVFHVIAHKCTRCNSYNTRQTKGGPSTS